MSSRTNLKGEYNFPADPGFNFDFDLAVNDSVIFNLYSYRILIFKIDDASGHLTTTERLKEGLQGVVRRCPPLGGVVVNRQDKFEGQYGWKQVLPGPGIRLVVRDLRIELDYNELERRGFPTDDLKFEQVVPISPAPIMEGEAPGSVFQYTWITGGALLTVGIDHPIADGNGMNTIMGMLAEECKKAQLETKLEQNSHAGSIYGIDRSAVRALESSIKNKPEDHPSYTFLTEPPSHDDDDGHSSELEISPFLFQISGSKLDELKSVASTVDARISTHDAISALVWRSVMLSRYAAGTLTDLDAEVEFHVPTDARRFAGLNNDYVGNMVYYVTCSMPLRDLLGPDSLPHAAAMIRSALNSRDASLIAGYHSLCKALPDLSQMTFGWIPRVTTTAVSIGSSWRASQMYGADWGHAFGPVKSFRSPDMGFFGIFKGLPFICPKLPETGSAEFQAWLEPKGWDALQNDDLFTKFCVRIGT